MRRILAIMMAVFMFASVLGGCKKDMGESVNDCVLQAWEGKFSKENRKEAIETYASKYIPVYAMNIEQGSIRIDLNYEGVECGQVTLAPVDDSKKDWELNTVVDFSTEIYLDGNTITIPINWWYSSPDATRQYQVWSYLFWVKDADGVQRYYYFRVDYAQA